MSDSRSKIIASLVSWAIVTLGYAILLTVKYSMSDLGCEDPIRSSNYGQAVWQWWPPGTACEYTSAHIPGFGSVVAHVDRPSVAAGAMVVVLIAWPFLTWLLARRARRSNHSDPSKTETMTTA